MRLIGSMVRVHVEADPGFDLEVGMVSTQWRVWLVLSMLIVAVSAGAQVTDCTGEQDGTPCVDTDNNICTNAACDHEECNQQFSLQPPGTTCPDTDGNVCTIPSCNPSGDCSQNRSRAPEGTECGDNARCDGEGNCRQVSGNPAPALSVTGMVCLTTVLVGLGFWQMRRRSVR
jgi:hypothetical protein